MHTWSSQSLPFLRERAEWFKKQAHAYWREAAKLLPLFGKEENVAPRYLLLKSSGDGMARAYWEKIDEINLTLERMKAHPTYN